MNYRKLIWVICLCQGCMASPLTAQDLDPRAYARLPIQATSLVTGFSYSYGGILTDPTLPIKNLDATAQTVSVGVAHTFSLFKLTSQVLAAVPYTWAEVSGLVLNQPGYTARSGLGDTRLRFSVLVLGGPAATLSQLAKAPRKTILGLGLNVVVPTGQFFPDKLINIGTHRFSYRPEIALSQPLGNRWLVDVYAGAWFFSANQSFYPGDAVRTQDPMGAFQAHISYNISPMMWIALDGTYYVGGQSSINDIVNDDRQSNSRIGMTAVMPVGKQNTIRFACSTGAVVRVGQDFTTFSIGWQRVWLKDLPM